MTQIVTTGKKYTDIDGLACVIAFAELQNLIGVDSLAVFKGQPNQSVTSSVKSLGYKYVTDIPKVSDFFSFAMMDISDPAQFPDFVDLTAVNIVYDHHFGFEEFWKTRIGDRSRIVEIGAAATLVFEEVVRRDKLKMLKNETLLLLYTAIISNSLNLNASVTKKNDIEAVNTIRKMDVVPRNWDRDYFAEVSTSIVNNLKKSVEDDTKIVKIDNQIFHIGQLELWESLSFLKSHLSEISSVVTQLGDGINFLNCPSISENRTYFVTENEKAKSLLQKVLNVTFDGSLGKLDKLILRKEILKEFQKVL